MSDEFYRQLLGLSNFREEAKRDSYARALFPWPGGKSKNMENIIPNLPYRNTYIEPFGGSGAILLSRNPSNLEVFNDRYAGVTCFYRVIRDRQKMDALVERLNLVLHSREEFVWSRDTWKNCEDEVERAARWWYMVTCSFSAIGKNFGRAKQGKSQFGSKLRNNIRHFAEVHERLERVQIENMDWKDLIYDYNYPDVVWYLDPPYYKTQEQQYECEFTEQDHNDLMSIIPKIKGFVALSGYQNPLYDSINWDRKLQWKQFVTTTPLDDQELNYQQRGYQLETLWIKN